MAKKKDRIIIDTNLLISFLLTKNLSGMDQLFSSNTVTLVFSQQLLDEFIEVSTRPKFKKYFSFTDLQNLLLKIRRHAEFIEVTSQLHICRDGKDDFLLSLAKDGRATHLLTGDKDLLDIKKFGKTTILTVTKYLNRT